MGQVQEAIEALISVIKTSDEYLEYQRAKQTILKYPPLKEKADEFLRRNFEFRKCVMPYFAAGGLLSFGRVGF